MDVTDEAFTRAKFNKTYLYPSNVPNKNTYDSIVWLLVIQHINDDVLLPELKVLLESLKDNGKLYLQYYENNIMNRGELAETHGGVDRTKEYMTKIITQAGGKILKYNYLVNLKWGIMTIGKEEIENDN